MILLPSPKVNAASITYTPLPRFVSIKGTVDPGNNTREPGFWSYFSFDGTAGEDVTITARRLNGELDLSFAVWDGLEADTNDYSSIFDNSTNFTRVTVADDQLPPPSQGLLVTRLQPLLFQQLEVTQ